MVFLILVTVLATFAVVFATAVVAFRNNEVLHEIQREITTSNGSSVAQLADAQETRRVERVDPVDRTVAEYIHLAVVPPVTDHPMVQGS